MPHSLPYIPCIGIVADRDVQNLANKWAMKPHHIKDSVIAMSWCIGPVLNRLRIFNAVQIAGHICVFALGYYTGVCHEDGSVSYPPHIGLLCFLAIAAQLAMEYQCLKYATVPYIQAAHRFRLLTADVGFTIWAMAGFFQSGIYHVAGFTQSLFAASSVICQEPTVVQWWHISLQQSSLLSRMSWVRLWHIVVFFWGLSMLRSVHALLYSIPRWGQQIKYELAIVEGDIDTKGFHFENYINSGCVTTGEVFGLLAEGVGMHTIMAMRPTYPRVRATHRLSQVHKSWEEQANLDKLTHKVEEVLQFGHDSISRASIRLLYNGLFKIAFGSQMQVTRLALVLAPKTKKIASAYAYFSIGSTLLLAPLLIKYASEVFFFTQDIWNKIHDLVRRNIVDEHFTRHHDGSEVSIPYQHRYIMIQTVNIVLLSAIFLTTTLHAVIKLVMLHRCPHSLWNVPWPLSLDLMSGCIKPPDELL
jgi:hypothetical protein